MTEPSEKIIIDEDWKSQVQAEKEMLARQAAGNADEAPAPDAAQPAAAPAADTTAAASDRPQSPPQQLPAPTISLLITSLAMQAMYALGLIADPQTGKGTVRLEEARHVIDTVQLLEEKTRGNLTPAEQELLRRTLYDLRMEFVAARDAAAAGS